nr:retrovirus-related Pol polyprotein LINE-1 [Tanacetum cinerariifolium]
MPGRSTTEAIHLLRSLTEKYRERQRDLHMAFLDLEKAYDNVPRELVWKTLLDKGTPRRYSKVIKDMAASGVLCDKRIPLKLKGTFYKAAIRPAMLYGSECWPITKALAFRVEVAELRMLRWTCGNTMVDMISNRVFRSALDVDSIIDKMREGRLRWFEHVKRRPQSAPSASSRTRDLVRRISSRIPKLHRIGSLLRVFTSTAQRIPRRWKQGRVQLLLAAAAFLRNFDILSEWNLEKGHFESNKKDYDVAAKDGDIIR